MRRKVELTGIQVPDGILTDRVSAQGPLDQYGVYSDPTKSVTCQYFSKNESPDFGFYWLADFIGVSTSGFPNFSSSLVTENLWMDILTTTKSPLNVYVT